MGCRRRITSRFRSEFHEKTRLTVSAGRTVARRLAAARARSTVHAAPHSLFTIAFSNVIPEAQCKRTRGHGRRPARAAAHTSERWEGRGEITDQRNIARWITVAGTGTASLIVVRSSAGSETAFGERRRRRSALVVARRLPFPTSFGNDQLRKWRFVSEGSPRKSRRRERGQPAWLGSAHPPRVHVSARLTRGRRAPPTAGRDERPARPRGAGSVRLLCRAAARARRRHHHGRTPYHHAARAGSAQRGARPAPAVLPLL